MPASDEQLSGPDSYFGPLRRANYIRLVTFRRCGVPVPAPVHVVTDGPVAYYPPPATR